MFVCIEMCVGNRSTDRMINSPIVNLTHRLVQVKWNCYEIAILSVLPPF